MQKILAGVLTALMILSLGACGESAQNPAEAVGNGSEIAETKGEETEPVSDSREELFLEPFDTSPTIEEKVLWENENFRVTATGLSYTSGSADLNLMLENRGNETLTFRCQTAVYAVNAVNGYMIDDGYFNESVDPGETAEVSVGFGVTELNLHGINAVAQIQIGISVSGSDLGSVCLDPCTVYTSIADTYDCERDTYAETLENGIFELISGYTLTYSGTDEVYNKNGITISSEALFTRLGNDAQDHLFVIEADNQSGYSVYLVLTDVSINGVLLYEGTWSSDFISVGNRRVKTIDLDYLAGKGENEDLLDEGIDSLSFTVKIMNESYAEALTPEEVTITVR